MSRAGEPGHFAPPRVPAAMRSILLSFLATISLTIAGCGSKENDKLSDADLAASQRQNNDVTAAAADTRCESRRTGDAVKTELFARAAEIRGKFADNYARIAGFALLQLEGAAPVVAVAKGSPVDCRAHATLRLPPGLHASGERTQLGGDIAYSVAPDGMVALGSAEAVTEPLATLSQSRGASAPPQAPLPVGVSTAPPAPSASSTPVAPPSSRPVPPRPPVARPTSVATGPNPSFNCARAISASDRAICESPSLAALDRAMVARYVDGLRSADPDAARLLRQTRDPFVIYRARCQGEPTCIDRITRGRMREIDDIVAGRWQGNR